MNLERYKHLERVVKAQQRKADKAAGVLEQLKKELLAEFGCRSLAEAKAMLDKLERQEKKAEAAFSVALAEFEKEYGHLLGEEK